MSCCGNAYTFAKMESKCQRETDKIYARRKQYRKARYRKMAARFQRWAEEERRAMDEFDRLEDAMISGCSAVI